MAFDRQPGYVNTVEDSVAALAELYNEYGLASVAALAELYNEGDLDVAALASLAELYNAPVDLTDEDDGTVDAEWDADAAAVVNNIRTRLGEIEAVLVTLGAVQIEADE